MTPNRCCRDSLKLELEKLAAMSDGVEIPCRWCADGVWIRQAGVWLFRDALGRSIDRMAQEMASPEYAAEKARVLGKDR